MANKSGKRRPVSISTQIQRAIRKSEEVKFLDNSSGGNTTVDYTGLINNISLVTTGTGVSNKIGSSIHPRWLELRIVIDPTASNTWRYIVFQDTMATGAAPITSDVLSTVGSTYATVSPYNFENYRTNKRFKIHLDHTIGASTGGPGAISYTKRIPLGGFIGFQTGNVLYKNTLYILFISDSAAAVGVQRWYTRLCYTDA